MVPNAPPADWRLAEKDPAGAEALVRELGIAPLIARILCRRGFTDPAAASAFLNPSLADLPDPRGLAGLERAMEILVPAVVGGAVIGVAGDYDADGVTSTALLVDFLRSSGASVVWELPHRLNEGYGFSPLAAERLAADGAQVVVTVDCGISDHAGVQRARQLGMPVVVSDHHALPPGPLVPADAVINPHQPDCPFPTTLAGVGLAFYLAAGLRAALKEAGWYAKRPMPNLRHSLDLVALGTCADVVELMGHNRVLVAEGAKVIREGRRMGMAALARRASPRSPVDARDISFGLAPRVNAAGRMEHASLACELMLSDDPDRADRLAARLDQLNVDRRQVEQEMVDQALDLLASDQAADERACIVLGRPGWHRGVLGIVASRLLDITGRPVMLFAVENGKAVGSGRSLEGFHMQEALSGLDELLINYGGHAMAAGASLATDNLERLAQGMDQAAAQSLESMAAARALELEAEMSLADLGPGIVTQLAKLGPFGQGNPEPLVLISGARMTSGRMLNGAHLKMTLEQGGQRAEAIAFNWRRPQPDDGALIDLAVQPRPSSFRPGTLDLIVSDLRPAS